MSGPRAKGRTPPFAFGGVLSGNQETGSGSTSRSRRGGQPDGGDGPARSGGGGQRSLGSVFPESGGKRDKKSRRGGTGWGIRGKGAHPTTG